MLQRKTSSKIRLGLLGVSGRMGKQLTRVLRQAPYTQEFELVYASSGPHAADFYTLEHLPKNRMPQVMVDFSSPVASLAMAALCAEHRIPMLVCTTGFNARELRSLGRTLRTVPWMRAPNTSVGVHLMRELARGVGRLLPRGFHLSMTETHHKHKKDAPSGTAVALREAALADNPDLKLPISSVRKGRVVGVHTLRIAGEGEELTLTHRALNRSLFAHGALRLARELSRKGQKPGLKVHYSEISL